MKRHVLFAAGAAVMMAVAASAKDGGEPGFAFDISKCQVADVFERTVAMYGRKPVVFTEIGQRSSHGCVSLPYDAGAPGAYDAAEQADIVNSHENRTCPAAILL